MDNTNLEILSPNVIDDHLSQEKSYWQGKLSGELAVTGLPLDFKRPVVLTDEQEGVPIVIGPKTAARLIQICGNKQSLVFAALAAALKISLYKYTGVEDVIVGTAIHEEQKEVASLNKALALRTRIRGSMTAGQALDGVKRTLAEAYENQKYPFDRILELLNLQYSDNRSPLFDVVVLLDNIGSRENLSHLKSDLTVAFSMKGDSLAGEIVFRPALFMRSSVETFAGHYQQALQVILDHPEIEISKIQLLSEERRSRLISEFNETASAYPKDKTIHRLFEEQVARTPERVAVVLGDQEITYLDLNHRANRLARKLKASGVGHGELVGVCLEHSIETVVAILGILKSGAAYVPFDPAHPIGRMAFIIEDGQLSTVVTHERFVEGLPPNKLNIICLDVSPEEAMAAPEESPDGGATPDDLAYIIYTSGSTGQPKGVKIRHAALVNYIWWAKDVYMRGEGLDFPLYSSLAFDLTVTSVFTPLITGNRIYIYPRNERGGVLADILRDRRVGALKLTPSHLSLIKDADNSQSRITRLIVGGEALETELARKVYQSFGGMVEIFNEYGPTEATVGCMIHQFDFEKDERAFVPIGRPAANMQIYILDEELNPAPENVVRELYISGDGLADGYINKPELTAEKFLDHPFQPGKKIYRTGDLARWLPEGVIEFVGRCDEQVKFHGHRIELSEIRAALNQHPQIRESVVVLTKDRNGNDALVAYYVSRQELEVAPLRVFLSERIIQETIPNVFIHLEKLPLTLNGKVNYRALPTLEEAMRLRRAYAPPQNEDERILADIWAQVLGVEQVGVHDDFFELGGHSLLATQVTARAREAFQVELPMTWLFEAPTVADLALIIEQCRQNESENGSGRIQRADRGNAEELLTKLDQLTEGNVDLLLNSLIATQDQVADGFPLTMEELDSLYQEILQEEGVSG